MINIKKVELLIHKKTGRWWFVRLFCLFFPFQLLAVLLLFKEVTENKILDIFNKQADRRPSQELWASYGAHKAF